MVAPVTTPGSRSLPTLAKYDVIEEIGHGGMATVYRAKDHRLAREVAVKVIHPHLRDSAEVAHRFVVEAQAVAKLRHANIVEVFDVSAEDDAEKFLVVELVRGSTLRKLLKERAPLPPEIAAAIGLDVLAALTHAHAEGVVHRDVKPENVLIEHRPLRTDGETPVPPSGDAPSRVKVKLTDFGIAKLLDAQGVTSTGQVLGSPAHMAPEQIEGGAVDARADVFGMGVMLYEAMVGHLPFEGSNPAQVLRRVLDGQYSPAELERPTVGKRWSTILDRALAHDANERYASASEMRDALAAEIKRVGVESPVRELESYFDDPEGYEKDHKARTIKKLCDLAQSARREDRSLDAANDYNRALAYAPDDPQLLRIVARMQRDAARARMLRRALPLALATIAAMAFAYFLTQSLKQHRAQSIAQNDPSATASQPVVASVFVAAPASVSATAPIIVPVVSTSTSVVAVGSTAAPHAERTITLASVTPATVNVSVDGKDPEPKSSGDVLKLDDHEHTLRFTCAGDACDATTKKIAPGKKDDAISVELHVKDATLIVTLDATVPHGQNPTFGIEQYPALVVKPGVPVPVTVPPARYITVIDRNNPSRTTKVDLRPGQSTTVPF